MNKLNWFAGVGRHDDQILRFTGQVDDLAQLADDLIACVQVFEIDGTERIDDFARVDVERNDPRYAEPFVNVAEHTRSQSFASLFFVLPAVGVGSSVWKYVWKEKSWYYKSYAVWS